jgi:hypothetical protein
MWRCTPVSEGIRFDGHTLVVRISIRFQPRGRPQAHRRPDGCEIVPTDKPQPDGTLVKALVRAWRWQRLLDTGVYTSVSEIGARRRGSTSPMSAESCG